MTFCRVYAWLNNRQILWFMNNYRPLSHGSFPSKHCFFLVFRMTELWMRLDLYKAVVELSGACLLTGLWQPCSVANLLIIPTRRAGLSHTRSLFLSCPPFLSLAHSLIHSLTHSLSLSFQFIQNRIIYIKSLRQITVGGSNLYLIEN